jgi:phosphatidylglycerol---prolipoprotein diacylglyceryl transferase
MYPTLFDSFGIRIHSYTVCLATAFVVVTLLTVRASVRHGRGHVIPPELGILAFLGALVGGKLFFYIETQRYDELWRALLVWHGGGAFFGGLLGAFLAGVVYLRWRRIPVALAADLGAPYFALGEGIVRVGCILNGCCFGKPCAAWFGITYPEGSYVHQVQAATGVVDSLSAAPHPVHAAPLYMLAGLVLIFAWLQSPWHSRRFDGAVFIQYALAYGILRFAIGFFRDDSPRMALDLTLGQWLGVVLIPAALVAFLILRLRARREGPSVDETGNAAGS